MRADASQIKAKSEKWTTAQKLCLVGFIVGIMNMLLGMISGSTSMVICGAAWFIPSYLTVLQECAREERERKRRP